MSNELKLTLPSYTLILPPQGIAAVAAGLAELKYSSARPWIEIIEAQVRQQQDAAPKPEPEKAKGKGKA